VTAGVVVGVVLDAARSGASADRRANLWLGAAGIAMALTARQMSFLPPLDPRSAFWSTSASFFFIRLGLMVAALTAAWLWERRPSAGRRWSPLQAFGRSTLFVYWIHVEMVYGLVSVRFHSAFSLVGAWAALAVFSGFILACVIAKDRFSGWWKGTPVTRDRAFAYAGGSAGGVNP
jgi:fucose 4-O-acetylase-like acetyltransferase